MYTLLGVFLLVFTLVMGAQDWNLVLSGWRALPRAHFRLPYPEGLRYLLPPWLPPHQILEIKKPGKIIPLAAVAEKVHPQPGESSLPVIPAPRKLHDLISRSARRHGVEERLVRAVISLESGFNPAAVSPEGAVGLMQLMPRTAHRMGVRNAHDPQQNIAGGVKYLKLCLDRFDQDVVLALAAYNAGPGNVEKYDGCPPFRETRRFVSAVMTMCYGRDWRKKRRENAS
jgi:soluble lytic murein transglycosylase-like protein